MQQSPTRTHTPCVAVAAFIAALGVAGYAWFGFSGADRIYRLWYYAPAAALAGAFIAARITERPHGKWRWAIDVFVALVCLARPLTGQPPVSGHAWFCIHALLTCRHPLARDLALFVTAITLYAKIVLWHWDVTLWPGLAAGLISGWAWRRVRPADR
jgi:hypothetical protein